MYKSPEHKITQGFCAMSSMYPITQRILLVVSLALSFGGESLAATERLEDYACYGKLQKPLFEGGYSPGDCTDVKVWVEKIGDIVVKGSKFSIFDLQYETTNNPGAAHYGERIIIIKDDKAYVGQYSNFDCECNVHIRGTSVYLAGVPKRLGNRISFDSGSPPDKVYLNGYVLKLYK